MSQVMEKLAQKQVEKEQRERRGEEAQAKQPVKENRALAKGVLAIAVAASILIVGPLKLNSYRNKVESIFKSGTETAYTESVSNFIQQSVSAASTLVNRVEALNGKTANTEALASIIDEINKTSDENKLMELYSRLYQTANAVYNEYAANAGTDGDNAIYRANADIQSYNNSIYNISYWQYAEKYNAARSGFPANLLGGLFGIDKMPE